MYPKCTQSVKVVFFARNEYVSCISSEECFYYLFRCKVKMTNLIYNYAKFKLLSHNK